MQTVLSSEGQTSVGSVGSITVNDAHYDWETLLLTSTHLPVVTCPFHVNNSPHHVKLRGRGHMVSPGKHLWQWSRGLTRSKYVAGSGWSLQVNMCDSGHVASPGPVFCLLLRVSSGCARPITGQVTSVTWAHFLSLARSKLRLCSANHRQGYWSNLPCDWPSTAWAYSKQETENRPWSVIGWA